MKAIMAISSDGFFCKDQSDDMKWTGELDKSFFKMYTHCASFLIVGYNTAKNLPELKDRNVFVYQSEERPFSEEDKEKFRKKNFAITNFIWEYWPETTVCIGGPSLLEDLFLSDGLTEICISTVETVKLDADERYSAKKILNRLKNWKKIKIISNKEIDVSIYRKE